jgi:glycosyltransferase involved in cell wall biosynthesis
VTHHVGGQGVEKEYFLGVDLAIPDFTNEKYARILFLILEEFDIDIVHIDSHVGHTFDVFLVPTLKNIPIVCTIHDFFYICPTFHLVDNNGDYCSICKHGEENHRCLQSHQYLYSRFDGKDLFAFRDKFRSFLANVDAFVFPSNSTKEIFLKYYDINEQICRVIPHGTSLVKKEGALQPRGARNFRVGILGSMLKHKGQASVEAIMDSLLGHPIDFYHFGDGDLSGGNLTKLGRYDQDKVLDLLHSKQIDVILLLSTWPETFSYTLTESIAANIPPIVTKMGALAERVVADNIGWLVDYRDVAGISDLILKNAREDNELEKYKQRISLVKLKTLSEMNRDYEELYESLLAGGKCVSHKMLTRFGFGIISADFACSSSAKFARLKTIKINSFVYRIKARAVRLFDFIIQKGHNS